MGYREKDVYIVHFIDESEKQLLFDTLADIGFQNTKKWLDRELIWPGDTCTFAINLNQKSIEYLNRPFICAWMVSGGIRFHSVQEFQKIAESGFPERTRVPVFHIPHDGGQFPKELLESVSISRERFLTYHRYMQDTQVCDMVPCIYHLQNRIVKFPVSRLLCDVERFIGPEEIMERYGMGFCYERAWDGTRIKNVTPELREKTLVYYRRHHEEMDRICDLFNRMILFDLHSYRDEIVPRDFLRDGVQTPDVCIGTDPRFTPPALTEAAICTMAQAGFTTAVNYPYSGCFVPDIVLGGKSSCDCASIMLEFHKRTYMEKDGQVNEETLAQIRALLRDLAAACSLIE